MHNYQAYIGHKMPPSLPITIKERRLDLKLTQKELLMSTTNNIDESKQYILSRLEAGKLKKVSDEICILCEYLEIDLIAHIESPNKCMSEILSVHMGEIWKADPERAMLAFQIFKNLSAA